MLELNGSLDELDELYRLALVFGSPTLPQQVTRSVSRVAQVQKQFYLEVAFRI